MDADLLARLLDRHAAALELYAAQWTRCAADVVQEAFVRLIEQRPLPTEIVPWLYRVVRNGAISAARSERRRRERETAVGGAAAAWFEEPSGFGLDAETATRALKSLPAEQREIVVARLWGGLTFEEIGRVTGVSSSTAHRRYEAALAALREVLGVQRDEESEKPTTAHDVASRRRQPPGDPQHPKTDRTDIENLNKRRHHPEAYASGSPGG